MSYEYCMSMMPIQHHTQVSGFVVPIRCLVKVSSCLSCLGDFPMCPCASGPRDVGGCHPKGQRGAIFDSEKKTRNTDFDFFLRKIQ